MGWLDLIGWGASALLVWSLLQTRILRLRVINLIGSLVLIFYNAMVQVWPMVGLNVVLATINIVYLARLISTRHDDRTYDVVEVRPDDAFLAHTLRIHGPDIARFNPAFRWNPDAPGRAAFLIMRGDEVVGVFIIRDGGDATAQVELDYVTKRFRDFAPGEFVYRRSSLLTERGYRTVFTPPGMVAPYYGRLGFRRIGQSYVLDLDAPGSPAGGAATGG